MNSRVGITEEQSIACRMVLLELAEVLEPWWDDIVVVGGVAVQLSLEEPSLILPTMDLDLALDIRTISRSDVPEDMHTRLLAAYYEEPRPGGKVFRYFRTVTVNGKPIEVPVDFLTGERFGTDPDRSAEDVEGIRVSKLDGCELAFQETVSIRLEGQRPDGSTSTETVRIPTDPYLLAMKGFPLHARRPKDARDIYLMVANHPGGVDAFIKRLNPLMEDLVLRRGLEKMRIAFQSIDAWEPKAVVEEVQETGEEAENTQRAAYEQISALLDGLGIP